jgi:hypothetical protein
VQTQVTNYCVNVLFRNSSSNICLNLELNLCNCLTEIFRLKIFIAQPESIFIEKKFQLFVSSFCIKLAAAAIRKCISKWDSKKWKHQKISTENKKHKKVFFLYFSTKTHFSLGGLGVSNWNLSKIVSEQVHFNMAKLSNFVDKLLNLESAFVISTSVWLLKKFDSQVCWECPKYFQKNPIRNCQLGFILEDLNLTPKMRRH